MLLKHVAMVIDVMLILGGMVVRWMHDYFFLLLLLAQLVDVSHITFRSLNSFCPGTPAVLFLL